MAPRVGDVAAAADVAAAVAEAAEAVAEKSVVGGVVVAGFVAAVDAVGAEDKVNVVFDELWIVILLGFLICFSVLKGASFHSDAILYNLDQIFFSVNHDIQSRRIIFVAVAKPHYCLCRE